MHLFTAVWSELLWFPTTWPLLVPISFLGGALFFSITMPFEGKPTLPVVICASARFHEPCCNDNQPMSLMYSSFLDDCSQGYLTTMWCILSSQECFVVFDSQFVDALWCVFPSPASALAPLPPNCFVSLHTSLTLRQTTQLRPLWLKCLRYGRNSQMEFGLTNSFLLPSEAMGHHVHRPFWLPTFTFCLVPKYSILIPVWCYQTCQCSFLLFLNNYRPPERASNMKCIRLEVVDAW